MRNPATLLITKDLSLVKEVEGVTASVPNLRLQTMLAIKDAASCVQRHDIVLLLPHVTRESDYAEVARLLQTMAALKRLVATVVLSDKPQAKQALALLRQGAADYLARPLDLNRLTYLMDVLTVRVRAQTLPVQPASGPLPPTTLVELDPLLYVSAQMGRMMEQVDRVAPQDTSLLLIGETGTGKSRLARLIHQISPRRDEPFLVVNCGALAANLMESEMFGHVKGAFTGADRDRTGKFAEVGHGTLLLDEIDALPVELQTKLLRVVDERVFEAVGSNQSLPMQARLIAASNCAIEREVAARRFRADLYYRLNVVSFYLLPLREQPELIPPLAKKLLAEIAARGGKEVQWISPAALTALCDYHWPGNIRELRNVMERAVALSSGTEIQIADLTDALRPARVLGAEVTPGFDPSPPAARTLAQAKDKTEVGHILKALEKHKNNRLRAAAELGISRMTLYKKLQRYGLPVHKGNELPPADL